MDILYKWRFISLYFKFGNHSGLVGTVYDVTSPANPGCDLPVVDSFLITFFTSPHTAQHELTDMVWWQTSDGYHQGTSLLPIPCTCPLIDFLLLCCCKRLIYCLLLLFFYVWWLLFPCDTKRSAFSRESQAPDKIITKFSFCVPAYQHRKHAFGADDEVRQRRGRC